MHRDEMRQPRFTLADVAAGAGDGSTGGCSDSAHAYGWGSNSARSVDSHGLPDPGIYVIKVSNEGILATMKPSHGFISKGFQ